MRPSARHWWVLLIIVGCDETGDKPALTAPKARSQAVVSETPANQRPVETAGPGKSAGSARVPVTKKAICTGQLGAPGKPLSSLTLETQVADGEAPLPEALEVGHGRWTWFNFWAAWCVPCREEIPRLKSWEAELAAGGRFRLTFISLDDDARQLTKFLHDQPKNGLRGSYWIKEGDQREEWFASVTMEPDPELPAHILVDPKGLARCVLRGAIEDSDLPELRKIVRGN